MNILMFFSLGLPLAALAGEPAKTANLGGMPSCQTYALQAPVPDTTKMRLRKAIINIKSWEKLYNQTWDDFGVFDRRCKAYLKDPTQDTHEISEIANMGNTLQFNSDELRKEAKNIAPTVKSAREKPKKTPGSFLELKKLLEQEAKFFEKRKDQRRAEEARKCGSTLDHHASQVVDYMHHFDNRAKSLCKMPSRNSEDPDGKGAP